MVHAQTTTVLIFKIVKPPVTTEKYMGTFFLSVRKYPPLMHLKLPAFHTRIIYR
jgi:hypothetical protein